MQSNYLIAGCAIAVDFRDLPANPHKGTAVALDFHGYNAEQNGLYSFNWASAKVEQYIPFFNEKRVIALHGAVDMTFHNRNQVVPFYMQPTLGGFNTLRGFRTLRFYDDNAAVVNAEYRWEICTGFDMAIFADAGEVFHRPSQFSMSNRTWASGSGSITSGIWSCVWIRVSARKDFRYGSRSTRFSNAPGTGGAIVAGRVRKLTGILSGRSDSNHAAAETG
jgi:outer membrane protein assembly factor BamA